jgi:multidrug resistance efflux pump
MLRRIAVVVVVAGALLGALLYSQRPTGLLKCSGVIEVDEVRVGSRVGGRVSRVHVEEGQPVRAGDPLVELEPFQLRDQLEEALAGLEQARAEWARLEFGYRDEEKAQSRAREEQLAAARDKLAQGEEDISAAEALLELAEAELELALSKYNRIEALFAKKGASAEDMDRATTELRVARATVRARREELGRLKRLRPLDLKEISAKHEEARQEVRLRETGYRPEEKAKARSAVEAAEARVQAMRQQLDELVIRAPVDGNVEAINLRPGDLVNAGTPAVSITERGRLWVRTYVPENHLDLAAGRELPVTVDSFPGRTFRGRVTYVSQQAEFTPGNVQTPEERSKQVFRIKVQLLEGQELLRAGMLADVWLKGLPR